MLLEPTRLSPSSVKNSRLRTSAQVNLRKFIQTCELIDTSGLEQGHMLVASVLDFFVAGSRSAITDGSCMTKFLANAANVRYPDVVLKRGVECGPVTQVMLYEKPRATSYDAHGVYYHQQQLSRFRHAELMRFVRS